MKFYEGNSLPERVHSNCSVSGNLWPQAPTKCLRLGEPGMAHPSSLDRPACVSLRGSGRALGAPLPQARWWAPGWSHAHSRPTAWEILLPGLSVQAV